MVEHLVKQPLLQRQLLADYLAGTLLEINLPLLLVEQVAEEMCLAIKELQQALLLRPILGMPRL